MAYRGNNYSLVIDSHFQPFTMQEMLVPFAAYKEAYEKDEAAYIDLKKQADKFKYLSETLPENSEAKRLYEGYANRLNTAAQDFSTHGRGMSNIRDLFNLKADYEGTIGMLDKADTNLQKELELRRQMSAKDPSILWSTPTENLNIDSYLYGKTPNNFGISGDALYAAGAQAAQAASKRKFVYNDKETTLGGYFYDIVQKLGYGPEAMNKFMSDINTIPELKAQYDNIVKSYNLDGNLTGGSRGAADTQIIRGMMDGALYTEQHSQQRNYSRLTAAEQADDARADKQLELSGFAAGYKRTKDGWVKDPTALSPYTITNSGNPVYLDEKNRPYALGSDGVTKYYDNDKDGNYTDKNPFVKPTIENKEAAEMKKAKDAALLKLDKSTLKNESGFDVQVGNERQHYDYVGALVHNPKQDKWYSGTIGEDFAGHKGIAITSDVNVIDWKGNYSITRWKDKAERRVLAQNEIAALANNKDIADRIEDAMAKANLYTERTISNVMSTYKVSREDAIKALEGGGNRFISDYQLVAVKNDKGDDDYLIAIRTN